MRSSHGSGPAGAVLVPDGLDVEAAVALFVQGRTAIALAERAEITRGDRVLVLAAAGGVGSVVVQLATAEGAFVVGAASGQAKTDLVRQLGADMAVDAAMRGGLTSSEPPSVR